MHAPTDHAPADPDAGDDEDRRYAALAARDARFDGWFWFGVTTTGVYCRPSCPSRTPRRRNVRFFRDAAAAQRARFRPCRRCRPDAVPGSPEWNRRADVVGRAMRLIADGVVDREGVTGLARHLGYSTRQLHRLLVTEVGASAVALARVRRLQLARTLIESTGLEFTQVAFAAGFASVRQFNASIVELTGATPTRLRRAARRRGTRASAGDGVAINLRLAVREPFAWTELLDTLARHAIDGVEHADASSYTCALSLPSGLGAVTLRSADDGSLTADLHVEDLSDLSAAVRRCRRLLDLDADPVAVDASLLRDPALRELVDTRRGLRVIGAMDGFEAAVRIVVAQRISVTAARTVTSRFVERHGRLLDVPRDKVTRGFPDAERIAATSPDAIDLPGRKALAVHAIAEQVASGRLVLDDGADRRDARERLAAIDGVGPWTVELVAMRALGDPDAFCATDLGLRRAAASRGIGDLARRAERWRPWRSYAAAHLWRHGARGPRSTPEPRSEAAP